MPGIIGKKVGNDEHIRCRSQINSRAQLSRPVHVSITQIKTETEDGYTAVQLGYGGVKRKILPIR
jgi:hypothetical protein